MSWSTRSDGYTDTKICAVSHAPSRRKRHLCTSSPLHRSTLRKICKQFFESLTWCKCKRGQLLLALILRLASFSVACSLIRIAQVVEVTGRMLTITKRQESATQLATNNRIAEHRIAATALLATAAVFVMRPGFDSIHVRLLQRVALLCRKVKLAQQTHRLDGDGDSGHANLDSSSIKTLKRVVSRCSLTNVKCRRNASAPRGDTIHVDPPQSHNREARDGISFVKLPFQSNFGRPETPSGNLNRSVSRQTAI